MLTSIQNCLPGYLSIKGEHSEGRPVFVRNVPRFEYQLAHCQ